MNVWIGVYVIGFFVWSIINVHLVSMKWLPDERVEPIRMFGISVSTMFLGLVWPLVLLWFVIVYCGLFLTKVRQKRE